MGGLFNGELGQLVADNGGSEPIETPAPKPKRKRRSSKPKSTKAPQRARGRARSAWVDVITGEPVREDSPGAIPTGDFIARARPRKGAPLQTVEIAPSELGPASYRIDLSAKELAQRAQQQAQIEREETKLERRLAKLKGKQEIPGIPGTYRSAGLAARDFLALNEFYYAPVTDEAVDFSDAAREWADGQEVWVARKGRGKGSRAEEGYYERLGKTKKGQRLLSADTQSKLLLAILTWVFSKNDSKRWADVDWSRIEALNSQIDDQIERQGVEGDATDARAGHETLLFPAASGVYEGDELAKHPEVRAKPRARATVEARINAERLAAIRERLEQAYKRGRDCLPPDVRAAVNRRLRYLRTLEANPLRIESAGICAHARASASSELVAALESRGGDIEDREVSCTFPLLVEDTERLIETCDRGYDPDWPTGQAESWAQDPGRYEQHIEASPEPIRSRAHRAPEPYQQPETVDEAVAAFDAQEAAIFGPPDDEEIPF